MSRSSSQAIILIEELIEENNDLKDKNKQLDQLAKQQNAVKTLGTRPLVPRNQICYVYHVRMACHECMNTWNEMNVMNTESWNPEYWTSPDQG